jgi:cell division protein FtsI/penicillin-binding protein 2
MVLAALLLIAALRTADLGMLQGTHLSDLAQSNEVRILVQPAMRGAIVDASGRALALSEPGDDIEAYRVSYPATAAAKLAPLLHESSAALALKLEQHPNSNQYLARQVPAATAQRIESLGINGIALATDNIRYYPFGSLAGQLLGGMHSNGSGAAGLEAAYDRALAGSSGKTRVVYAGDGKPISVDVLRQARTGASLRLTIDAAGGRVGARLRRLALLAVQLDRDRQRPAHRCRARARELAKRQPVEPWRRAQLDR